MILAFLYNVRHQYPDPNDPRSQTETDFDDPATIKEIIRHLKKCGYKVISIEADEKAYLKLYRNRNKIDLVFNFSEGIYGYDREAQIPAMLEMLTLPYTGSRPLTQALGLNKAKTKEILLANNISTLPFQLIKNAKENLNGGLCFPLIVKPVSQGSGAGITNKSVVQNKEQLKKQINFIIDTFSQEALIEPFLDGREFSVGMIGNPPRILPIIEADHSLLPKEYLPLDSLEVKWIFEEQSDKNHLKCPAPMDEELKSKVENLCHKAWQALEVRDWCRFDIRCDRKNNPYILEINSPVGLLPPEISMTSYMPLAARAAGIDYDSLLKLLITTALKRYGKA